MQVTYVTIILHYIALLRIFLGIRTPMKVIDLHLEQPTVYDQLSHIERMLERHYRDMQVSIAVTLPSSPIFTIG